MKKLFAFSIKTVWELIKYIKPLYELIAAIVKIIKNDRKNDDEDKDEDEKKEEDDNVNDNENENYG